MTASTLAGGTSIEWTDYTFNPWWGCEKVSPGCAHCYAETLSNRRAPGQKLWGAGHDVRLFDDGHWAEPLRWARVAPGKLGRRPRVFTASMADVFEPTDDIRVEGARRRLFDLILRTPELDWLVLTKRPDIAREWLPEVEQFALVDAWPIPNLWLGTSIENSRFTWRADVLRQIPAAVRFISAEPLLGSLFQDARDPNPDELTIEERRHIRAPLNLERIDWVIVGGESGHGARPMHPDWARELRDACLAVAERPCACGEVSIISCGIRDCPSVPPYPGRPAFFFKQWGAWAAGSTFGVAPARDRIVTYDGRVRTWPEWEEYGRPRNVAAERANFMHLSNKKAAGRELDWREWSEFPRSAA